MRQKIKSGTITCKVLIWLIAVLCIGNGSVVADAREKAEVLQTITEKEKIKFILGGEEEFTAVHAQIGQSSVDAQMVETEEGINTIILIDNSLSITNENQDKIVNILKMYAEQKPEKEAVSIAVYGEEIQYLLDSETDKEKIALALESIQYENKDSYFTDILYEELKRLGSSQNYTRFIVATDGVDNKSIGYTKEELIEYLKNKNYPIYALGCRFKNNESELENLFSIARMTNANYFLLDDYQEFGQIVDGINEQINCLEIIVPKNLQDGSEKTILITLETENGEAEIIQKVSMPFGIATEEVEVTEESQTDSKETEEMVSTVAAEAEWEQTMSEPPDDEAQDIDILSLLAGIVILLSLVILIVLNRKKKETGSKKEKKKKEEKKPVLEETDSTVFCGEAEEDVTIFVQGNRKTYIVTIKDMNDPAKIFRYPMRENVIIGRKKGQDVNIVINYDGSISARHCKISVLGDSFYIEDLQSTNGTWLNGRRLSGKERFESGSKLKLGNLEFTIDVIKSRE